MRKTISVVVVLTIFLLMGCAASTKNNVINASYKALSIGGNSYDVAMSAVGDLYKEGLVGEDEKAKALELAGYYYDAYHLAVNSLKIYAKTDIDAGDLQQNIYAVGQALGELLGYLNPLLHKYGKEILR